MATWDDQMAVLMGASTVAFGRTVMYSSAEGSVSFPVQAIEVDPVADDTESPGNWAQLEMNLADFVANGISGPSKLDSVLDAGTTYIVFDVVVKRVMKTVVLKLRRQDLP